MNIHEYTGLLIAIGVSALIRWITGFGFSMVFVPIATFFIRPLDAIVLTMAYEIAAGTYMFIRLSAYSVIFESLLAKVFALGGVFLAYLLSNIIVFNFFNFFLILSSIISFLLAIRLPELNPSKPRLLTASVLSGIMGFFTGMAGPPIIFYYYSCNISLTEIRRYLSGYFLLLYISSFLLILTQHGSIIYDRANEIIGGILIIILIMKFFQSFPLLDNKGTLTRYILIGTGIFLIISVILRY